MDSTEAIQTISININKISSYITNYEYLFTFNAVLSYLYPKHKLLGQKHALDDIEDVLKPVSL